MLSQAVAGPPAAIVINVEERSQVIPEPLALIVWSFLGLTVVGVGTPPSSFFCRQQAVAHRFRYGIEV